MLFSKVLIANRGEIAVRLVRALRDLGIASVAVHARDDAAALHAQLADTTVALDATGPSAYLDATALIEVAKAQGCDAVHPGYGFLSERADFAQACADAGLVFIGPTPEQLGLFGDKARARELATQCDVPVMPGNATDFYKVALPKDRPLVWFLTATDERKATVSTEHQTLEK